MVRTYTVAKKINYSICTAGKESGLSDFWRNELLMAMNDKLVELDKNGWRFDVIEYTFDTFGCDNSFFILQLKVDMESN